MIFAIISMLVVCFVLAAWAFSPTESSSNTYSSYYAGVFTFFSVILLFALFIYLRGDSA